MRINLRFRFFITALFLSSLMSGNEGLDSLKSYVDTASVNNEHLNALISIGYHYIFNDPNEAEKYIQKADSLGNILKVDNNNRGVINHHYSILYNELDRFDEAIDYSNRAIKNFQEEKHWERVALCYMHYGRINAKRKNYKNSIEAYIKAAAIYDSLEIKSEIGQVKLALGNVSYFNGNKDKALAYYKEAKELCYEFPSTNCWEVASSNLGVIYTERKMPDEALAIYHELETSQKKNDHKPSLATTYFNMAEVWDELYSNDYKSAEYSKLALDLRLKIGNPSAIIKSRLDYGRNMVRLKKYNEAKKHLTAGLQLAQEETNIDQISNAYRSLAQLYDATADYKNAYQSMKIHKELRDSIRDEKTRKSILELETKYDTGQKEQEIALLEFEKEIAIQKAKSQRNIIGISVLAGVLLSLLSVFLYRLLTQNKNQKNLLQQAVKEKDYLLREIHHRVKNNLQVISSLLFLQSENLTDPVAQDALNIGRGRVKSMALIHQNLYGVDQSSQINLKTYLEDLVIELFDSYNLHGEDVDLQIAIDEVSVDVDILVPLGLIINELISNALKYAYDGKQGGLLKVTATLANGQLDIQVKDNGKGFNKSKNTDSSFGTELIESFVDQLGAAMNVVSHNGVEVNIQIPLKTAA